MLEILGQIWKNEKILRPDYPPLALPASDPACGEGAIVFNRSLFLLFFTGSGKPSQGLKKRGELVKNCLSWLISDQTLGQALESSRGPCWGWLQGLQGVQGHEVTFQKHWSLLSLCLAQGVGALSYLASDCENSDYFLICPISTNSCCEHKSLNPRVHLENPSTISSPF